ncbi:MAG: hypothetical protein QOH93_3318 [Chloroflexia bacterium]|nr:hypothetical protein [Chloroflexia bacterium]
MRGQYTTGHGRSTLSEPGRGRAYRALSVLLLVLCVALAASNTPAVTHAQQTENHAGLVVQFGDGTTNTYCIPFTGDTITGFDLLLKTGLDVTAETQGALGAWVCRIGPDGCNFPEESCVCQSYGPGGKYWVYHHLKAGAWKSSSLGSSNYKVHNGEVEGWAWSSGKGPGVTPSFGELCAAVLPAPPEPTPTNPPPPPPTSTPIPPPTDTAVIAPPTRTPKPAAPTATDTPYTPPPPNPLPPTMQVQLAETPTVAEPPSPTSAPTDTPTTLPTATSTTVPTKTHTPTQAPTNTPTTTVAPTRPPAPTATPTAIVRAAGPAPQTFVQVVALGMGLAVVGGLALWFGLRGRRT